MLPSEEPGDTKLLSGLHVAKRLDGRWRCWCRRGRREPCGTRAHAGGRVPLHRNRKRRVRSVTDTAGPAGCQRGEAPQAPRSSSSAQFVHVECTHQPSEVSGQGYTALRASQPSAVSTSPRGRRAYTCQRLTTLHYTCRLRPSGRGRLLAASDGQCLPASCFFVNRVSFHISGLSTSLARTQHSEDV